MARTILLIDDDRLQFRMTRAHFDNFRGERYELDWAPTYEEGIEKLLGGEVYHYHSKMILKDAKVGGAWAWHQDYGYWYQNGVLTPNLVSVFIAVDPCTKENGCLQVIRHSHHCGRINHVLTGDQAGADRDRVDELLKRPGISSNDQVLLGYALAKAFEDQGDLTASFHALQTASAIRHRLAPWDIQAEHERIDGIIKTFDRPLPRAVDANLGHGVIFISCLPRSGSTLTEHILASHSMVEGANEISDLQAVITGESSRRGQYLTQWAPLATAEDWHRLGCEYLERTAQWRKDKPFFTDKNLGNWALVGPALAMLPGARVVNTLRDPLETCFACYRQLFRDGASFSYDFESMANYYAGYARISKFWKGRFPENWHDHIYEDMLADPEGKIRELLAFCGLPFEPGCLEFHKTSRAVRSTPSAGQVRQPLQSNTSRASRYGALLDPLRDLLRRLEVE